MDARVGRQHAGEAEGRAVRERGAIRQGVWNAGLVLSLYGGSRAAAEQRLGPVRGTAQDFVDTLTHHLIERGWSPPRKLFAAALDCSATLARANGAHR